MHRYKNLTILGTSHIAIQSVKQVEKAVEKLKPGIIALELDKKRFQALISRKRRFTLKDVKRLGFKGFILNYIGAWAEKKLGKTVGTKPGAEMKKAIQLAKETKAMIALVDQDIQITIRKLIKNITLKEKMRFLKDLFLGTAISKREFKKLDLKKVPPHKTIVKLIKKVKERYPNVYHILIKERNKIMAKNLNELILQYPKKKIFAVVGAGHEEDIIGELKSIKNIK